MTAGGFEVEHDRPPPNPDGYQPPSRFTVRGELPAGEFEFERPDAGSPGVDRPRGTYFFDSVSATGAGFRFDDLGWYATGSRFRDCAFRQERRGPIGVHTGAQGNFGHRVRCVYEDCRFDHIDFGLQGGGFLPGDARFERCTFKYCSWRHFRSRRADFVGCRFQGVMQSAWFYGADPDDPDHLNEFRRNDLTGAKPRGLWFRDGLDFSDSRLPEGPEYLLLEDFQTRLAAARRAVQSWPEAERRDAEALLDVYRRRPEPTFFAWRGFLADPESPVWELLESAL